jgi:hypothetical protein
MVIRGLFTLLCCLLASPAWAAVALDGTCTASDTSNGTTHDLTHTVGATANFLLAFVLLDADVDEITGATWDFGGSAQAMTSQADSITGVIAGEVYTTVNPAVGTLTLRATTTNTQDRVYLVACDFTGVNTAAPLGTIVETESTGTVAGDSLAFTLNTGGLAIAALFGQSAWSSFAHGADQTEQFADAAGCDAGGGCHVVITTATVSPMDYTWTSTGVDFWHVVVPINAASTRRPIPPIIFE